MGRIGKISSLEESERECRLWSEEDEEFVVVTRGGKPWWSWVPEKTIYTAYIGYIAFLNVTTGELSRQSGDLSWNLPYVSENHEECLTYFDPNTAYRIVGRTHISGEFIFVLETLEEIDTEATGVRYPALGKVMEEYRKFETLQSEAFGKIVLNKELNRYEGKGEWCGKQIMLSFAVNDLRKTGRALKRTERIFSKADSLDQKMRRAAAQELTELANEWRYSDDNYDYDDEDEIPAISKDEFSRRLCPCEIEIDPYGEFTFYFEDDNMFFGHAISVYVNERGSVQKVQMER